MPDESIPNQGHLQPESQRISLLAVFSLISGFIFILPGISGIVAIILGIIALYSISMHKDTLCGRGFAVAGIVVGIVQLIALITILVSFVLAIFFATLPGKFVSPSDYEHLRSADSSPKNNYDYSVNPSEFNYYNNEGISLQDSGKPKKALEAYSSALEIAKKEMGLAYYGIGSVYMNLEQYEKALEQFDKAIAYNPKLFDAYQNKAVTYRLMGRYQDSVYASKRTVFLFPDFARAYCSMGWAYEYLGNYKEAINAHLEAIRLAPEWQFPRQRIEYCLSKIKDKQFIAEVRRKIKEIK